MTADLARAVASAEAKAAVDAGRAEAILELCELLDSYAISAREAAWRGDRRELGVYLKALRLTLIETLKTYRALDPEGVA
jgi:hypothetical protein